MNICMVGIRESGLDCTYFRGRDVAPRLDGDTLTVIDGYGTRRRWGTPNVRSNVTRLTGNVIMVSVTGWHKWTVKPVGGNYYFVCDGQGNWQRWTANCKTVKLALANR